MEILRELEKMIATEREESFVAGSRRGYATGVAAERKRCAAVMRDLMGAICDRGATTDAGLACAHGLAGQSLQMILHGFEEPHRTLQEAEAQETDVGDS